MFSEILQILGCQDWVIQWIGHKRYFHIESIEDRYLDAPWRGMWDELFGHGFQKAPKMADNDK